MVNKMNKGLKNYTKQLTQEVGNACNVSFNINEEDSNLHITFPILKTIGLSPIDLSIIFNAQDAVNGKKSIFARGSNLNYYGKISEINGGFSITNADGSVDEYLESNDYKNLENNMTLNKVYTDNYQTNYNFKLIDKYENYKIYESTNLEYPSEIVTSSGESYKLDFTASVKKISNNKGDVVTFNLSNGFVTTIEYKKNNTLMYCVLIDYENEYINNIMVKKSNTIIKHAYFEITSEDNNTYFIVKDMLTPYSIRYQIDGTKVLSFVDSYNDTYDENKEIKLTYNGNKTTITHYDGKKAYTFFDNNSLPLFEMDNDYNVVETEYDNNTKSLTAKSSVIYTQNTETNLFPSNNVYLFTKTGTVSVSSTYYVSSSFFNSILGNSVCKVTGTGKLYYKISTNGLATDSIQAIMFARQLSNKTSSSYVKVSLICDKTDSDIFKKEVIDDNFDLVTLGVDAVKTYNSITLEFELVGNPTIEIGGIQVLKKDFGKFYEYDDNGNSTGVTSGCGSTSKSYSSNNLISSSIGVDSSMCNFEYDDKNNLTKASCAYGVEINNEYNSDNLLTKSVLSNSDGKILETKQTYDSNGNVLTESDELENITKYNYDSFGKVIKVMDALSISTNYTYDDYDNIKQLLVTNGSNSRNVNYTYDNYQRLIKLVTPTGSKYEFEYDIKNNITKITLDGMVIYSYEYDEDGRLSIQRNGQTSDGYKFTYNSDDDIEKIYYLSSSNVCNLRYQYLYDNHKRISSIKDGSGNILISYTYDIDNNVVKVTSSNMSQEFQYDNLGNINGKLINVNNKKIYQSYDNVSRSKGINPEAIGEVLCTSYNYYVATFNDNLNAYCKNKGMKSLLELTESELDSRLTKDGIIPCFTLNSSDNLEYLMIDSIYPRPCGYVGYWFKPTDIMSKQYLFCQKRRTGVGQIGVYMQNSKLYLEVKNGSGICYTPLKTNSNVKLNEWNFFAINYIFRQDTGTDPYVNQFDLHLNAERSTLNVTNDIYEFDQGTNITYHIGHFYNNVSYSNYLKGKIALLSFGRNSSITVNKVVNYYKMTKDYIVDNQLVDDSVKTVDFSQSTIHTINQDILSSFEIYPLQSSVKSLNGKVPVEFDLRCISSHDKDRTFNLIM